MISKGRTTAALDDDAVASLGRISEPKRLRTGKREVDFSREWRDGSVAMGHVNEKMYILTQHKLDLRLPFVSPRCS